MLCVFSYCGHNCARRGTELPTESLEETDVTLLMESPLGPSEAVAVVELGTDLVLESPLDSPCTLLLTPISSWLNFKLTVAISKPGCFKKDCTSQ